jgi:predicted transposase YdaD
MSKPYDITSKELIELAPEAWPNYFGLERTADQVSLIDSDLSTISAQADKIIRVNDEKPWLLHIEFQTRSELGLARRLLRYNAMLQERHLLPVTSVAILLRKEANSSDLNETFSTRSFIVPTWTFNYKAIKIWELDPKPFLQGSLTLLPLAPLTSFPRHELPSIVDHIKQRFDREAELPQKGRLWTATKVLMGLKYDDALTELLLQGVVGMEDSVTYQSMVRRASETARESGRAEEARKVLRRLGTREHGPLPADLNALLEQISDLDQLEGLIDRVLLISSWEELLNPPAT